MVALNDFKKGSGTVVIRSGKVSAAHVSTHSFPATTVISSQKQYDKEEHQNHKNVHSKSSTISQVPIKTTSHRTVISISSHTQDTKETRNDIPKPLPPKPNEEHVFPFSSVSVRMVPPVENKTGVHTMVNPRDELAKKIPVNKQNSVTLVEPAVSYHHKASTPISDSRDAYNMRSEPTLRSTEENTSHRYQNQKKDVLASIESMGLRKARSVFLSPHLNNEPNVPMISQETEYILAPKRKKKNSLVRTISISIAGLCLVGLGAFVATQLLGRNTAQATTSKVQQGEVKSVIYRAKNSLDPEKREQKEFNENEPVYLCVQFSGLQEQAILKIKVIKQDEGGIREIISANSLSPGTDSRCLPFTGTIATPAKYTLQGFVAVNTSSDFVLRSEAHFEIKSVSETSESSSSSSTQPVEVTE